MRLPRHLPWPDWPATCQACGRWPASPVCDACAARFAPPRARCTGCGSRHLPQGDRCPDCASATTPSSLTACLAALDYAYPWDRLIARFKFEGEVGWAAVFARFMARAPGASAMLQGADLVTPVPLTARRVAERGHHPPWELIKALHALTPLPRHPALLMRLAEVPDQHSLPRARRLHNLAGVFAAHPLHAPRLRGRRVLLVDDVTTTGATLQTAARALRQAGAAQVDALVLARTPGALEPPL